jgi:hypothetical protein
MDRPQRFQVSLTVALLAVPCVSLLIFLHLRPQTHPQLFLMGIAFDLMLVCGFIIHIGAKLEQSREPLVRLFSLTLVAGSLVVAFLAILLFCAATVELLKK